MRKTVERVQGVGNKFRDSLTMKETFKEYRKEERFPQSSVQES